VARVHVGLLRHQEQAQCPAHLAGCDGVTPRRNNKPGHVPGFLFLML
jgi:hypothetical protein